MIASPENVDFYRLGAEAVSYNPKDIHTLAVRVTPENVGILSLEFEAELLYGPSGMPYFFMTVEREDSAEPAKRCVRLEDWIVVLWDTFFVFHSVQFNHAFSFDDAGEHLMGRETPGGFGIASGEVTGPEGTQVVPAVQ